MVVGSQAVTEDVLYTVLVKEEGILNSKPVSYVSRDITDPDLITPNILNIGRKDAALPQAVYAIAVIVWWRGHHSQNHVDQFWAHFT